MILAHKKYGIIFACAWTWRCLHEFMREFHMHVYFGTVLGSWPLQCYCIWSVSCSHLQSICTLFCRFMLTISESQPLPFLPVSWLHLKGRWFISVSTPERNEGSLPTFDLVEGPEGCFKCGRVCVFEHSAFRIQINFPWLIYSAPEPPFLQVDGSGQVFSQGWFLLFSLLFSPPFQALFFLPILFIAAEVTLFDCQQSVFFV